MLKLLGAALLVCAAARCGNCAAARVRERAEELERLERSLCFLKEELRFSHKPLPTLLERLGNTQEGGVKRFYTQVCAALREDPEGGVRTGWQRGIDTELTALRREERDVVTELGDVLGRYDVQTQVQALDRVISRLSRFHAAARADVPRLGRVYTALGVAGGLFAALILL